MSLYKRGGVWWMNFWIEDRHIQKSTKCKSKKDAAEVERAYRTQIAKGEVGLARSHQNQRQRLSRRSKPLPPGLSEKWKYTATTSRER
jgi:hypothetical protein